MRIRGKRIGIDAAKSIGKAFSLFLPLLICVAVASAQSKYTITDLGTLGGSYSTGYGVSQSGQVTGQSALSSGASHGFLYDGGAMTDLGSLGGNYSLGLSVNSSGQVAGQSSTANGRSNAFLYSAGTMTDLGTLGGTYSIAYSVNDSGQVAGGAYTTGNAAQHAFLYSAGAMTDLNTLGGTYSVGVGINSSGQVTGLSTTASHQYHAFLYSAGAMTDLGTLGGTYSVGYGINDSGQVAGMSYIAGNAAQHAFLYSAGKMTDLGTLGGNYSIAYSINKSGQVTGAARLSNSAQHAFLYSLATGMVDLNTLIPSGSGWTLLDGWGINDAGQISGTGIFNGQNHAFLLTLQQPPTTVATASPAPNAAGWNNSNVTVTLKATKAPGGSAVKQITYSASGAQPIASTTIQGSSATIVITAEGITTLSFFATDGVGNQEQAKTLIIRLDKTPPVISASRTPLPNSYGWNNTDVTVSFTCSDALSGLAAGSPPPSTVVSSEGAGQSVSGTCYDVAGNSASAVVSNINIDKTAPTLKCSATPSVLWPPNNKLVNIKTSVNVMDSLSGAAGFQLLSITDTEPSSDSIDIVGWTIGAPDTTGQLRAKRLGSINSSRIYTISYQGSDKAGNSANCSTTVTVPHNK